MTKSFTEKLKDLKSRHKEARRDRNFQAADYLKKEIKELLKAEKNAKHQDKPKDREPAMDDDD